MATAPPARCYWLSPFEAVDPEPDDGAFVCLHNEREVLASTFTAAASVVVVEAEPMTSWGYDPAVMLDGMLTRGLTAPDHLVAVLKNSHISSRSQMAFAVDMHRMCGFDTTLVLEHAVDYVPGPSEGKKDGVAAVQRRSWREIAARSAQLARGRYDHPAPERPDPETARLVEAMRGDRGDLRLSVTQKQILLALAAGRTAATVPEIAAAVSLQRDTARKALTGIADRLADPHGPSREGSWRPAYCQHLAASHAQWLISFAERHDLR